MQAFRQQLLLTLLPLLVIGGIVLVLYADNVEALYSTYRAQSWEKCPCELTRVALKEHKTKRRRSNRTRSSYSLVVRFNYEHQGRNYVSQRHDFWETQHTRESANDIMNKLERHPAPTCYVNPANPSEAVIDRSLDSAKALTLAIGTGIFLFACGISIYQQIKPKNAKRPTPKSKNTPRARRTRISTRPHSGA